MGDRKLLSLITHHLSQLLKGETKMADQDKSENKSGEQGGRPQDSKTGDPGRTPGKAEGEDDESAEPALCDEKNRPLR